MNLSAFIKEIIFSNIALKFFSLVLAITLWFFVMGEKKAEFSFADVPIVLVNKPDNLVVASQTAENVNLRVSGSRTVLATLSSSTIRVVIDLEDAKPGKTVCQNLIDRIKLPNGIKVTSISPADFSLVLEPTISKRVPLTLNLIDGPEEGYEVTRSVLEPEFVEVRLARSEAEKLTAVMTEPLSLSGVTTDLKKELSLSVTGLKLPSSISRKKATVSLTVIEKTVKKTLTAIPLKLVNASYRTTVTPSTVLLTVSCPYHLVDSLSKNSVGVNIDLKGVKPGSYLKEPEVVLPDGVSLIAAVPPRFKVVVRKGRITQ